MLLMGILVVLGRARGFDAEHPAADRLFYVVYVHRGEANWGSLDPRIKPWMDTHCGEGRAREPAAGLPFIYGSQPIWQGEAPVVDLRAPTVTVEEDERAEDGRAGVRACHRYRPPGKVEHRAKSLVTPRDSCQLALWQ